MNLIGFFGDFILQENTNPKIFIVTGTGLAPIFKMMNAIPDIPKNYIFPFRPKMKFFIKMNWRKFQILKIFHMFHAKKSTDIAKDA